MKITTPVLSKNAPGKNNFLEKLYLANIKFEMNVFQKLPESIRHFNRGCYFCYLGVLALSMLFYICEVSRSAVTVSESAPVVGLCILLFLSVYSCAALVFYKRLIGKYVLETCSYHYYINTASEQERLGIAAKIPKLYSQYAESIGIFYRIMFSLIHIPASIVIACLCENYFPLVISTIFQLYHICFLMYFDWDDVEPHEYIQLRDWIKEFARARQTISQSYVLLLRDFKNDFEEYGELKKRWIVDGPLVDPDPIKTYRIGPERALEYLVNQEQIITVKHMYSQHKSVLKCSKLPIFDDDWLEYVRQLIINASFIVITQSKNGQSLQQDIQEILNNKRHLDTLFIKERIRKNRPEYLDVLDKIIELN